MRNRAAPEALLLDLDGVLREFDPQVAENAEREFELPAGALSRSAMAWHRIRPALVGDETHEDWIESIVLDLTGTNSLTSPDDISNLASTNGRADPGAHDRALASVRRWQAHRGTVVPAVLDFVRQLRADGIPVGLATNATSLLDADLDKLGLTDEFDAVINSSEVGAHKPTGEFFTAACRAVGKAPSRCLFVDDDDRHVRGARAAGLSAYRWTGPADLPYLRAALTRG